MCYGALLNKSAIAHKMLAKALPALGWAFAIICCATLNVNIFTYGALLNWGLAA
jgi:hypothetical protein